MFSGIKNVPVKEVDTVDARTSFSISEIFAGFDVISFDVFDTLVIRPYIFPSDLFSHLELLHGRRGFADARKKAEQQALKLVGEEVTLDEIYAEISAKFLDMKVHELQLEEDCLQANPDGVALFLAALSKRKPIIITSDTYLPKSLLEKILGRAGVRGYFRAYISSEYRKTKRSGRLFAQIIDDFGISPNRMIHVGDDLHSDGKMAQQNGIKSHILLKPFRRYLKNEPDDRLNSILKRGHMRVDFSIIATLASGFPKYINEDGSFWEQVGFVFAGPLVLGFTSWIAARMEEACAHQVFFIGRDGFHCHRVFQRYYPNITSHYIHLNRGVIDFLENDGIVRESFVKYLRQISGNNQVLIVDSKTNNFSAQKFLLAQGLDCSGLYWCTGNDLPELIYQKYYDGTYKYDWTFQRSEILEFFLTAPTVAATGLVVEENGIQPIFGKTNFAEQTRIDAVLEIGHGIDSFAASFFSVFQKRRTDFSAHTIIAWTNLLLLRPRPIERRNFSTILHSTDRDHTRYKNTFFFDSAILISWKSWLNKLKTKFK